jgi:ABC-type Zn uptake system ZnuABC Zn-binding protein ZnuA
VQPSSGYLSELLAALKDTPPRIIIHSAYESSDAADWLASRLGAQVVQLYSSPKEGQSLEDWYQSMLDSLTQALNK